MKKSTKILIFGAFIFLIISGIYSHLFILNSSSSLFTSSPIQQGGTSNYYTSDGKQITSPVFSQDVKISGLSVLIAFDLFITIILLLIPFIFYFIWQKISKLKNHSKYSFYLTIILALIFLQPIGSILSSSVCEKEKFSQTFIQATVDPNSIPQDSQNIGTLMVSETYTNENSDPKILYLCYKTFRENRIFNPHEDYGMTPLFSPFLFAPLAILSILIFRMFNKNKLSENVS